MIPGRAEQEARLLSGMDVAPSDRGLRTKMQVRVLGWLPGVGKGARGNDNNNNNNKDKREGVRKVVQLEGGRNVRKVQWCCRLRPA